MNKAEALALYNKIIGLKLVESSKLLIDELESGAYSLTMKGSFDRNALRAFIANTNLMLLEDKENKKCIIYEP